MSDQKAVAGFFIIFLTVYFLESIGGFLMASVVVSIEKQFQISSRMSGLMVSAGDFGYIPSVVFVSYFGGKGNRAQWIGAGCLMIAFANILIGMSNFLFPVQTSHLNSTDIELYLTSDLNNLNDNMQENSQFLNYTEVLSANVKSHPSSFMQPLNRPNTMEISNLRALISTPFSFCNTLLNTIKRKISDNQCSTEQSNIGPFITIFTGLLILGVGRTVPFSLGLPLIDDNVKQKNLPIYFAGMFFIRILGPFLGFLIGSIVNNYYYSFDVPPGLTPRDPSWIGRWWAGFLGIGIAMLCPSLALYLYPSCINYDPNNIPDRDNSNVANNQSIDHNVSELHSLVNERILVVDEKKRTKHLALIDRHVARNEEGNAVVPISAKAKILDFISVIKTLMKSQIYVFSLIGRIVDIFAFRGFYIFLPKYLTIQFGLPQHKINLFLGITALPGYAIGLFFSSLIMRKFKLQGRKLVGYILLCTLIAGLFSIQNIVIGCKSVLSLIAEKTGVIGENFATQCNSNCNCNGMPLYPVCNRHGQAFYSPCHAGCSLDQNFFNSSIVKTFQNCNCSNSTDYHVSRDFCDQTICEQNFAWYFSNLAFSNIFGAMSIIPSVLLILRSVPPVNRSISLGFKGFLVSLIATFPSTIFWGWIIDKACIMWNTTVCKDQISQGACQLYDNDKLRIMTHLTYAILRAISIIPDIAVFYYAKDFSLIDERRQKNGN